jgi:hypothetical protein
MQPLAPITNEKRPPDVAAILADGDELVFDDLAIPDGYDAALAALQEERNLPRTANDFETRDSLAENSSVSSPDRSRAPSLGSLPSIAPSAPTSIAPERPTRDPINSEAFTHRLRWRPRWGLLTTLLALVGVGVGAALVSLFGGSSNVARTVARVVQHRSQPSPSPSRATQQPERIHPRRARDLCIRSFFPNEAFGSEPDLEFVCKNENLLDVAQRLNALAVASPGNGADGGTQTTRGGAVPQSSATTAASIELVVTPAGPLLRTWQLGWYELIATGIIQRSCCSEPPAIRLPISTGWCQQLQSVVTNIANLSTKPADISPAVRAFDETITCLMSQGKHTVYPYKGVPSPVQKAAFQQFLTRAAEMDARRTSKKF